MRTLEQLLLSYIPTHWDSDYTNAEPSSLPMIMLYLICYCMIVHCDMCDMSVFLNSVT